MRVIAAERENVKSPINIKSVLINENLHFCLMELLQNALFTACIQVIIPPFCKLFPMILGQWA